jgi:hypothetical protein
MGSFQKYQYLVELFAQLLKLLGTHEIMLQLSLYDGVIVCSAPAPWHELTTLIDIPCHP